MLESYYHLSVRVCCDEPRWKNSDKKYLEQSLKKIYPMIMRCRSVRKSARVEVLFTHHRAMKDLKKKFFYKNQTSNVLSFPNADDNFLGSIALGYQSVLTESQKMKKKFRHHLLHLAIHGLLHLLGESHDNQTDGRSMEKMEKKILARLAVKNPYI